MDEKGDVVSSKLYVVFCTMALALTAGPAWSIAPPYAEEWATPEYPRDVEVDPFGRVWVSCADNVIRVYTPYGGQLLFSFGSTGGGDGQFNDPDGIAFDASGNAYICDYAGARLQKFDSAGSFLAAWPIPSDRADHVTVDGPGDVYVTGYTDQAVHKYTADGVPIQSWTSVGGSRTGGILAAGGLVSVVQWDAPTVEQFALDGTYLGSFDLGSIYCLDIEQDVEGRYWVCDYDDSVVKIFSADGVALEEFGGYGTGPGEFNGAIGLALGPDGSVYVADESNYRVQRFGLPAAAVEPPGRSSFDGDRGSARILSVAPNPCRSAAQVAYSAPAGGRVKFALVDPSGRLVRALADEEVSAGDHRFSFSLPGSADLAAGVYFLRLAYGTEVDYARVILVR